MFSCTHDIAVQIKVRSLFCGSVWRPSQRLMLDIQLFKATIYQKIVASSVRQGWACPGEERRRGGEPATCSERQCQRRRYRKSEAVTPQEIGKLIDSRDGPGADRLPVQESIQVFLDCLRVGIAPRLLFTERL